MIDPWADEPAGPTVEPETYPRVGRCRKFCYTSEHQATAKARRVQRVRDVRLRAYRCDRCGAWHLTSEPKY